MDSRLTYYLKGVWIANVVLVKDEIKEDNLNPDTWTFISDNITLIVKSNYINNEYLGELPLPENLKIIYDDLLKMYETIKSDYENGNFNGRDGKSAYELAVENGFEGTEEEWLESLRYDHSDEFKQLAEQVKLDAKSAEDNATKAENAMNEANTTVQENVEAINQASTNAQNAITTAKGNAVQAVQSAQQTAENAISTKQTEAVQAVDTAKTSATQEITEQKESAVSAITSEKNSAMEAIETGKTNALETITTAKDEAIEEIENTGVPLEDIEKLAIKETAEGNPTIISDSADWRLQKLNIYGQSEQDSTTGAQLLNVYSNGVNNGVTWNCEGSVVIFSGTILEDSAFRINAVLHNEDTYKAGKTYYAKSFTDDISVDIVVNKQDNSTVYLTKYTVDGTEKEIYCRCIINNSFNKPGVSINKVAYAAITENAAMSEWEPYTGGKPSPSPDYPQEILSKEVSEIKVTGKNLFNVEWIKGLNTYENQSKNVARLPKGKYTLKVHGLTEADLKSGSYFAIRIKVGDTYTNTYWIMHPGSPNTKCLTGLKFDIVNDFEIDLYIYNNTEEQLQSAYDTLNGHIQINNGYEESQYEPYKEQVVNLTSPITLRSIPVDKGGNVTIDGQQYVSDVICEKDGVIGVERFNAYEKLTNLSYSNIYLRFETTLSKKCKDTSSILCNVGVYSSDAGNNASVINRGVRVANRTLFILGADKSDDVSNVQVCYSLAEPTFEPLSEEIQTQYKALKSYYPNTVVQSGAFNEVTFIADTKIWIENKINGITELALGIGGK